MKKNNKKAGFTVVELIISFAIVIPILIGLFKIVDSYREKQIQIGYKKEILSYKNDIISAVQTDLNQHELKSIEYQKDCGSNSIYGVKFTFNGIDSEKDFCVFSTRNAIDYIKYGDMKYELPSEFLSFVNDISFNRNEYKDIKISNSLKTKENYYSLNIKLKHSELSEAFSINMVFVLRNNSSISLDSTKFDNNSTQILNVIKDNNSKGISNINEIGKKLKISKESFRIIDIKDDKVIAFSEKNILVGRDYSGKYSKNGEFILKNSDGYGLQYSYVAGLGTIEYHENICGFDLSKAIDVDISKRLNDNDSSIYQELFGHDYSSLTAEEKALVIEYKKVYKANSKVWDYLTEYSNYLSKNEQGYKISTRLPKYSEVVDADNNALYNNSSYWIGTGGGTLMEAVKYGENHLGADCNISSVFGVRPMIEIELN